MSYFSICDVNPGIHNHRRQRHRGPWVDWGPRKEWRHGKEPIRIWRSDSNWNFPMKIKSKCSPQTTIVFIVKRVQRGYLACLNRSSDEEVMVVLQKSRNVKKTRGRVFCQPENTWSGFFSERSIFVQKLHVGRWNERWETPSRVFCPECDFLIKNCFILLLFHS